MQQVKQQTADNITKDANYISICIPTHPASTPPNLQEDIIRYKNALGSIEGQIDRDDDLSNTFEELISLKDDDAFWHNQSKSLLITADEKGLEIYKLPIEVTNFHRLGPLPITAPDDLSKIFIHSVNILVFSLNGSSLYKYGPNGLEETDLEVVTRNELLEFDNQSNQQFHVPSSGNNKSPLFHGHGGSDDQEETTTAIYLQHVAKQLEDYLKADSLPLVFAGDESAIIELKKHFHYPHVLDQQIQGNQEHTTTDELKTKLDSILLDESIDNIGSHITLFDTAVTSKQAVGYQKIIDKLSLGAVDTLLVPCLRYTNDSVRDGNTQELLMDLPEDVTNLQIMINATKEQGGNIIPVELGTFDTPQVRAILRF